MSWLWNNLPSFAGTDFSKYYDPAHIPPFDSQYLHYLRQYLPNYPLNSEYNKFSEEQKQYYEFLRQLQTDIRYVLEKRVYYEALQREQETKRIEEEKQLEEQRRIQQDQSKNVNSNPNLGQNSKSNQNLTTGNPNPNAVTPNPNQKPNAGFGSAGSGTGSNSSSSSQKTAPNSNDPKSSKVNDPKMALNSNPSQLKPGPTSSKDHQPSKNPPNQNVDDKQKSVDKGKKPDPAQSKNLDIVPPEVTRDPNQLPKFLLEVVFQENRKKIIEFYEGQDAFALAVEFCAKNKIPDVVDALADHLEQCKKRTLN